MQISVLVFVLSLLLAIIIPSALLALRLRRRHADLEGELSSTRERASLITSKLSEEESRNDTLHAEKLELERNLAESRTRQASLKERLEEQKLEIEQIHQKLNKDFELISHQLLQRNSESFASLSKKNVDEVVAPLREKLSAFENVVRQTYEKDFKDRADLLAVVKNLQEMNQKLGTEASNLSRALKGDPKARGNWGEFVLEMVLERSGLRKGEDYSTQESLRDNEQSRYQPDVIVHLPENKHIIIDSKVSLNAYESYVAAEDEDEKKRWLAQHVQSVRRHIKELSDKGYQQLEKIDAPEFVLLFIPIEASFGLTIQEDRDVFTDAWQKKIVLVSPSTLLATLRTVASIWQHEKQTRNALEIAKEGGAMVDKISAVLEDITKLRSQVSGLDKTIDATLTKIEGQGGLVSRARKLVSLGAKSKKTLPGGSIQELDDDSESADI
jgi:DNA recombination protein RmuC